MTDRAERQVGERLSEQARGVATFLRTRWNPENTTPPLGIADLLDSLARQLAEDKQEIARLRGLLDGEGPQVSMGTAAGILQREVAAREKAERQLAEAERENGRLRDRLGCAVEELERRHPLGADPITALVIRDGREALAALHPPDPQASPAEGSEGEHGHAEHLREAREVEDHQERKHAATEKDGGGE